MRRLFWLGVGVAVGVTFTRKAAETARQASPAGLASNAGDAVRELAGAIGAFGADIRVGMSEREQELSDVVEQRSGPPGPARPARSRSSTGRPRPDREADESPRRAGGRHAVPEPGARRARRAEI